MEEKKNMIEGGQEEKKNNKRCKRGERNEAIMQDDGEK